MKNLRELFTEYHNGFQNYEPWLDHNREMHRRHPLDVPEFGAEWLRRWEAVGKLLDTPARIEGTRGSKWFMIAHDTVSNLIEFESARAGMYPLRKGARCRIVLLDGTIIREWGPK